MNRDALGRYMLGHAPNGQGAINAAKTHCVRGHLFDVANTRRVAYGSGHLRICRTCERERMRRRRSDVAYLIREKRQVYARKHPEAA